MVPRRALHPRLRGVHSDLVRVVQLLVAVGTPIAAVTEWAYGRARKTGGPT